MDTRFQGDKGSKSFKRAFPHFDAKGLAKCQQNANRWHMRKPFRLRAYDDPTRPKLKFIVTFRELGKRKRRFFTTKKEAETFTQQRNIEFQNQGREHGEFPSALRIMAGDAAAILAPFGKTIRDAAEFYAEHLRQQENSVSVAAAVAELIKLKGAAHKSPRYVNDLGLRLGRFCKSHGERTVASITAKELDEWLAGLEVAPGTRNTFRRDIRTLFSFCERRGYCASDPAKRTERAEAVDTPPGILTPAQLAALLTASTADVLPVVAIGAFAGLRSAEIEKLDWSEVNLQSGLIEVTAAKSKTKKRRLVPIADNLAAWLQPLAEVAGPVAPAGLRKRLDAAKERVGLLAEWPQNALRHSYGSYRLAQCADAARVSLEMGNSPQMVFSHYRELVTPKNAARYWQITPDADAGKKIVGMR
jgi:site-specific recombinase XerD